MPLSAQRRCCQQTNLEEEDPVNRWGRRSLLVVPRALRRGNGCPALPRASTAGHDWANWLTGVQP
jgi:hypothetical protein